MGKLVFHECLADLVPGMGKIDSTDRIRDFGEGSDGFEDMCSSKSFLSHGLGTEQGSLGAAEVREEGHELLLRAFWKSAVSDGWEPLQMVDENRCLKGKGARIAFVREEQIKHRRELNLGEVAPAIGHGAIGEFQKRVEKELAKRIHL